MCPPCFSPVDFCRLLVLVSVAPAPLLHPCSGSSFHSTSQSRLHFLQNLQDQTRRIQSFTLKHDCVLASHLLFGVWVLTSWAPSSELRDTSTSQVSLPPQEPEFQLCGVPCLCFEALRILTSSFYSFSPGDGSCFLKLLHL